MSDKAGSYYSPLNQMRISSEVFGAYLNCPTKSWLQAADHPPTGSAYSEWLKAQNDSYRTTEREQLAAKSANDEVALSSDRENTKSGRWCLAPGLAVQVKMDSCVLESELHAVQRVPAKGRGKPVQLIPIRFAFKNKLAREDRLLLAFDAFVLSKSLGREVTIGKIIHGDERAAMTVKTSALAGEVRKRIEKITALLSSPTDTKGDQRNAHGHIFMTSRVVDEDGDFSKTKIRSLEIANVAPSKSGGFAKCGRCVAIAPCEKLDFRKT